MSQASTELFIRHFQKDDMPLLGELYRTVTANGNAVFWWIGDEENWCNVYCAFENGKMIAKGQVGIINVVPPGRSNESRHSIYVNLKTIPERANDEHLLEQVYRNLYLRAVQLKESLPSEYETILCVGNDSKETANNQFFIGQGFRHLNSLFQMSRNLNDPIPELSLHPDFDCSLWKMETSLEVKEYLDIEAEIWPDTPLGLERMSEYKRNPLWTSMVIRQAGMIVGALMAWREEDYGVIEDVFVRESWRKRGFAQYLLAEALEYLKSHGLQNAKLMVLATNKSALSLYKSVGFYEDQEEIRYYTELK